MKVILINGSPHKDGCTFTALNEVAKSLKQNGIDTEIIHIGLENIHGCIACRNCYKTGQCVFHDCVNEIAKKFEKCDGLVIGTPVYYASVNGTLLSFLDRLFYSTHFDKTMKVGACVVSARRGGCSATFDILNKYFTISNMPIVSSQYWNQVHGKKPEDVYKDQEGLQTMRTLALNMAWMLKNLEIGKKYIPSPEYEEKIYTNFIPIFKINAIYPNM